MLGACGFITDGADAPAENEATSSAALADNVAEAQADDDADCLTDLWSNQPDPNRAFDRAHDLAEGGSISCATGTTPSEFEAMLADIRQAASSQDRAALLREIEVPLLYIDHAGERRDMPESMEVEAHFDEIFPPEMLDLLKRIELEDMTVVPDQGGFFELGSVWLVATERGGRPRLRTVNQQALNEAIIAAASEETETLTPAELAPAE
ncbi:hypothetical protein [Aurantiacibacter sediminis]|uniref:Uncharacterized protein n=1 Tax=Aurantiacibacter sediminis TaxID=2793064 RepID=A0ABS0N4H9_9SPHN|nr:hypothetical protein [Aurantiacibacter sediminis]MBH5322241.1 hypothetical protein [Aurantiacibacter sediminis]